MVRINVNVDGVHYSDDVEPRLLLVHYLRDGLGRVGTPIGCDTSNCGVCTVRMNGQTVKSCTVLAVQADDCDVTTIQGLAGADGWHPVQKAFHLCHGLQCGYCTPGMIMAAVDLLERNPDPSEAEIRDGLEGNLCRCTGYQNIVRAVQTAAAELRGTEAAPADSDSDSGSDDSARADSAGSAPDSAESVPAPAEVRA